MSKMKAKTVSSNPLVSSLATLTRQTISNENSESITDNVKTGSKPFSFRINNVVLEKLKKISSTENISITDILNKGAEIAISRYEQKHGTITVEQVTSGRGNVNQVFDV